MKAMLTMLFFAALGLSCGGPPCCSWEIALAPGTRYEANIPSTDGGTATKVQFVLTARPGGTSPGSATLTFTQAGREVSERLLVKQRQ